MKTPEQREQEHQTYKDRLEHYQKFLLRMGLMREAGNPEQKEIIIWWTAR